MNIIRSSIKSFTIKFIALCFVSPLALANGAQWLFQGEMIQTGDNPNSIQVRDINRDGFSDIVTSYGNNLGFGGVSILNGVQNGYGVLSSYQVGINPWNVALGDINADQIVDIVTANQSSNYISILIGNNDSSFKDENAFVVGQFYRSVALSDFNGDNRDDLVFINANGSLMLALAEAGGSYSESSLLATIETPEDLDIFDINQDGLADILVSSSNAGVNILFGKIGATFTAPVSYTVDGKASGIAVADINADNKLDIIAANEDQNSVTVLLKNNGVGYDSSSYDVDNQPRDVVVADFNGDSKLDIATVNFFSGNVSLLLANNENSFDDAQNIHLGLVGSLRKLSVANLNNDNLADLVAIHNNTSSSRWSSIGILTSANNKPIAPNALYQTGEEPTTPVIADLNNDQINDVAIANSFSNTISVYYGQGDGSLTNAQNYNTVDSRPRALAIADLNQDGLQDMISANGREDTVSVFYGQNTGGFSTAERFSVDTGPISVAVADVNRDNRLDIITSNLDDNTISVLYAKADGGFEDAVSFNAGNNPFHIKVADFNQDGFVDVVTGSNGNLVNVLLGDPSGFAAPSSYTVGNNSRSVAVGDVNDDGLIDIASASGNDPSVYVLIAQQDGSFATPVEYDIDVFGDADFIAISDANVDGYLDLVVTNNAYGLTLFLGDGSGTFNQTPRQFSISSRDGGLAIGDLTQDKRPEVAVVTVATNMLEVVNNIGQGKIVTNPNQNGGGNSANSGGSKKKKNSSGGGSLSGSLLVLLSILLFFRLIRQYNQSNYRPS